MAANPRYLEDELAKIARQLDARPHYVYGNRDKGFTFEGQPIHAEPPDLGDGDITFEGKLPASLLQK